MDASNWRDQLQPETRRHILNNIMDQIKLGYRPGDHDDEFLELQKIAQSVEQKSYAGATSQSDYLDNIASKMLLLQKAREREWRYLLRPDSRQRIVNKIADKLRRHLPFSGPEGSQEIWMIAQRFEEKIFNAATSQSDYLRKISLKMLAMENNSQRCHGQPSYQLGSDNEPANPVDTNLRMQSSRSRRRPTWTRDYHMG